MRKNSRKFSDYKDLVARHMNLVGLLVVLRRSARMSLKLIYARVNFSFPPKHLMLVFIKLRKVMLGENLMSRIFKMALGYGSLHSVSWPVVLCLVGMHLATRASIEH